MGGTLRETCGKGTLRGMLREILREREIKNSWVNFNFCVCLGTNANCALAGSHLAWCLK